MWDYPHPYLAGGKVERDINTSASRGLLMLLLYEVLLPRHRGGN